MHERNIDWLPFALAGDQTHNIGMCPDQESNQRPFSLWDDTQPTVHTSQGSSSTFYYNILAPERILPVLQPFIWDHINAI